jgi:hypothetical protein
MLAPKTNPTDNEPAVRPDEPDLLLVDGACAGPAESEGLRASGDTAGGEELVGWGEEAGVMGE